MKKFFKAKQLIKSMVQNDYLPGIYKKAAAKEEVDPKKVTITANDASQIYNGKALTESDFTASALESGDTHEFAVVMTEASTITNVGTQPNVIATVDGVAVTTGTETAVGNYLVTTANGTLTVNPKAVTITAKDANKPYDGDPLIQPEFTATDLEAGDDHQFTVVMTEASTITDVGTKPNVIATVDGVSVTTGTATAVGNYTVTTADGTLTITQDEVALTITSATKSWTYDSTLHKEEVYAVTYNGEEVAAGEDGKTFALENGDVVTITATAEGVTNVSDNATNNNTYTYTITRGTTDTSGNYKSVVANVGTLTINPKAVTITAKDDEKAYDGNPLVQPGFTASELEEGDTHTFNVAMTADSTITNPGTKPNVIATVDGISVTTGTATAVGNYTVTTANGTLKITEDKKPIIIKSADGEWTYDGEDHTKYEYTVTYGGEQLASDNGRAFTLSNGDILTITPAENAKVKHVSDSGEENNLYSYVIKRGDTVTTNYYTSKTATYGDLSITTRSVTMTSATDITTRSVTMTSATDTKEYDGLPLTNSNVAVTGDGFATGEGATYSVTGTQTEVGNSENTFTYTLNEGTVAGDYSISTVNGKLTVTKTTKAVTIESADGSKKYDGSKLTAATYTVKYGDTAVEAGEDGTFTLPTGDKLTITDTSNVVHVADTAANN